MRFRADKTGSHDIERGIHSMVFGRLVKLLLTLRFRNEQPLRVSGTSVTVQSQHCAFPSIIKPFVGIQVHHILIKAVIRRGIGEGIFSRIAIVDIPIATQAPVVTVATGHNLVFPVRHDYRAQ